VDLSHYDIRDKLNLRRWLDKLLNSEVLFLGNTIENNRKQLSNVLKYLRFAEENPSFREQFTAIINDATTSCHDRTALSAVHVGIAYQMASMDLQDTKALADFIKRSDFSMKKLEKCARDLMGELPTIPGTNITRDVVEVYLAYPIMLKQKLHVPIDVERMSYFAYSGLTLNDLNTAYETVSEELANEEGFYLFLANHDQWNKAPALNRPEPYAEIRAARDKAAEAVEAETLRVVGEDPIHDFAQAERYHQIQATYTESLIQLTKAVLMPPSP
jgi:hypothetical protein